MDKLPLTRVRRFNSVTLVRGGARSAGFVRTTFVVVLVTAALLAVAFFAAYQLRYDGILQAKWQYEVYTAPDFVDPEYPVLTPEQVVQIGWAHTKAKPKVGLPVHPASSYVNFAPEKPKGTYRIGVFGCSFVEGSETGPGYDFPSLLSAELQRLGYGNIEVINFGAGNYGTHQAFLIWRMLGQKYGLDHAVLFPFTFHGHRDASFSYREESFGPVHARYINRGGALELAEVDGATRVEAMFNYHRIFPGWDILRYDSKAPMWLRVVHPTPQAILHNPLYVGDRNYSEAHDTYPLIFKQWATEAPKLTIVFNDDIVTRMAGDGQYYRSESWSFFDKDASFYVAPNNHYSALGNEGRANELAAFLTGSRQIEQPTYVADCKTDVTTASAAASLKGAILIARDKPAAGLRVMNPNDSYEQRNRRFVFEEKTKALLCLNTEFGTRYVPLPEAIPDHGVVEIVGADGQKKTLGSIHSASGVTGWIDARLKTTADLNRNKIKIPLESFKVGAIAIKVAGMTLLTGIYDEHLKAVLAEPVGSPLLTLRADAGEAESLTGEKESTVVWLQNERGRWPLLTLNVAIRRLVFKQQNPAPLPQP